MGKARLQRSVLKFLASSDIGIYSKKGLTGVDKGREIEMIPIEEGILIQKQSRGKHPVDLVYGILNRPYDTDTYIEQIRGE